MSTYKQIIIVRKDLNMSHGKMAAQVSHASMAFLAQMVKKNAKKNWDKQSVQTYFNDLIPKDIFNQNEHEKNLEKVRSTKEPKLIYESNITIDQEMYENWFCGAYTKCILEAKTKNKLLKVHEYAKEIGLIENEDYFLIWDNCYTELQPEEDGKCLTCIGFRPLPSETADLIGKKYHLYIG